MRCSNEGIPSQQQQQHERVRGASVCATSCGGLWHGGGDCSHKIDNRKRQRGRTCTTTLMDGCGERAAAGNMRLVRGEGRTVWTNRDTNTCPSLATCSTPPRTCYYRCISVSCCSKHLRPVNSSYTLYYSCCANELRHRTQRQHFDGQLRNVIGSSDNYQTIRDD